MDCESFNGSKGLDTVSENNTNQTTKRWYVVHARSGFEKQVVQALKERIRLQGMNEAFGDIIVPTEEVLEMYKGNKRKVPRKFFPGYVLVHMDMNEKSWYLVHKTPQVLSFLGGANNKPLPLKEKEVEAILQQLNETEGKPRPKVRFEPGQMVEIIDGPLVGFTGVIEEANYEKKNRLRVSVVVFQRATSVELDFNQVKAA